MGEAVVAQMGQLAQHRAKKPGSTSAFGAPPMPASAKRFGAYRPMETPDEDAPPEQIEGLHQLIKKQPGARQTPVGRQPKKRA